MLTQTLFSFNANPNPTNKRVSLSLFAFTGSDHDVLPPSHAITDTDSINTQIRICTGSHWSQGKLIQSLITLSIPAIFRRPHFLLSHPLPFPFPVPPLKHLFACHY